MKRNLDSSRGLVLAESVSMALAREVGRTEAKKLVGGAARRALEADRDLREELLEDSNVTDHLSAEQIDAALDPSSYLGSAPVFVDRALAAWREAS
jgi:3-carboxy-cis,cis-muconate cycloisomerase